MKLHEFMPLKHRSNIHEAPVLADGPVDNIGLHNRAEFEYIRCSGPERELSPTWRFKETNEKLVYAHFTGRSMCNVQLFQKSPLLGVQCTAVSKMDKLGGTLQMILANYDDALRNRSHNQVLSSDSVLSIGGWHLWDKLMDKYGHDKCYVAVFNSNFSKLEKLIKITDVKSTDDYHGMNRLFQIRLRG